jgi:hypothetical protein
MSNSMLSDALASELTHERNEPTVRWLIAPLSVWCDPPVIALTAAASAQRSTTSKTILPY